MWSPWSKKISEHGPHGPVSPIAQKLSDVAMRMILSSENPVIFFQMSIGLLVVVIDRDVEPLGVEAEFLGDQVPGERDRVVP